MSHELDCRGQACPAPVIQAKEFLEKENPPRISVLVDNEAAKENVGRFLQHSRFEVSVEAVGADYRVSGIRDAAACKIMPSSDLPELVGARKILVMIGNDRLGHGDEALGAGLLLNLLKTLKEMGPDLWRLILVNNGVKLSVEGAEALPILRELTGVGVGVLVCGTCLNHFQLLDKKQVGETTNMLDIVTSMQLADSVINV